MTIAAPSPQVLAIVRALVEDRIGIHYAPDDVAVFADKLVGRMTEAGFEGTLDYYYYLRYDDPNHAELDALIDALVVGETYFFRELEPTRAAIEHVVRPALDARGRARIWSAACATGEEPLSLAMLLSDAGLLDASEIVATDVSVRALAAAREGLYGPRALRALAADGTERSDIDRIAAPFLERVGTRARVDPSLSARIGYRRLNLRDAEAIAALGRFDLVLCRNVLIYFADETVREVVRNLSGALREEGRILVSASESLLRFGTALRCEERGGAFFYAKEGA